jgi:hypothetical protein
MIRNLNSIDSTTSNRDIILTNIDGSLKRVHAKSGAYDPLQYPLLFPFGDYGWSIPVPQAPNISIMAFSRYRLMERSNQPSLLHLGGKLFQQYVTDQFSKMEGDRLDFVKFNQDKLRIASYNDVQDAVAAVAANGAIFDPANIGERLVLPATFVGSPRYMNNLYQDAMAVVRHFGFPDLFVTFTTNPLWPEIQRELKTGQTASDRPDLVARVFNLKLKSLLKEISEIPGFSARVHSIEFQKRGLPHAHILIIFKSANKLKTSTAVDAMVSAEMPLDPVARAMVTKNMIHGPCGVHNINAPCMVNGQCCKGFPKSFATETTVSENGYPIYRRREGDTFVKNGVTLDNRWVVPHNLQFLMRYDAHLNFEIVTSIKSVKYVFKYIFKGPDMATVAVGGATPGQQRMRDEIDDFLSCRYVCAPEACWRIFGFDTHGNTKSVLKLAVHDDGDQCLVYAPNANLEARLDEVRHSTLTAWFHFNQISEEFKDTLYINFPLICKWDKKNRSWIKRSQASNQIGRVIWCTPFHRERYYMRMLLHVVPGCKSYEDLRTVEGELKETYQQACLARGMLENDQEWEDCISQASLSQGANQLRSLFGIILQFNNPSNPASLWEKFADEFSDDILHVIKRDYSNWADDLQKKVARLKSLRCIRDFLSASGKRLQEYLLQEPLDLLTAEVGQYDIEFAVDNPLLQQHRNYNQEELGQRVAFVRTKFNAEQTDIFDAVKATLDNPNHQESNMFYVDGPGITIRNL